MECSHFWEVHFRGSWGKDAYDRAIENIVFHRTPGHIGDDLNLLASWFDSEAPSLKMV